MGLHLSSCSKPGSVSRDVCKNLKFPLWLRGLRTWCCLCEDASSIPGLGLWVKDPALQQAAAQVADVVLLWLWCRLAAVAPI